MKHWNLVLLVGAVLSACGTSDLGTAGGSDATTETQTGDTKPTLDQWVPPDLPKPDFGSEDVPTCKSDKDCDDGKFCNGVESCAPEAPTAGHDGCLPGEAPKGTDPDPTDCEILSACDETTKSFPSLVLKAGDACDDGIACTEGDVCAADKSCKGTPDDTRCNDGKFCNGLESCSAVVGCLAGTAPKGVDQNEADCLVPGPCDEQTDTFTLIPGTVGKACNDAIDCTFQDACTGAGTCEGKPSDVFCTNKIFCDGQEVCDLKAGCKAGALPAPPADDNATDCLVPGPCEEATQSFPKVAAVVGVACNDGQKCTTSDKCDAAGQCVGTPNDKSCDDKLFCNGVEVCDPALGCVAGKAPTAPADANLDDCKAPGACDEKTKSFPELPVPTDTACKDAHTCTETDVCDANGQCVGTPNDALCQDLSYCNGAEVCDATAGCVSGSAPVAPSDATPNDCMTPGPCVEGSKSFPEVPRAELATCEDGNPCTELDACDALGACKPGAEKNCDDLDATTLDSCNPSTGQCVYVPNG